MRRATILIFWWLLSSVSAVATNPCEQEFTVDYKTSSSYSFLSLTETKFGDCNHTNRTLLYLGDPKFPAIDVTDNYVFWNKSRGLPVETVDTLTDSSGVYIFGQGCKLQAPDVDGIFADTARRYIRDGSFDEQWYLECRSNCLDLPRFENTDARLLWAHPGGLYKNYGISSAFFYPQSGILVIVTSQPLEFYYKNTLHGVLVFQLAQK